VRKKNCAHAKFVAFAGRESSAPCRRDIILAREARLARRPAASSRDGAPIGPSPWGSRPRCGRRRAAARALARRAERCERRRRGERRSLDGARRAAAAARHPLRRLDTRAGRVIHR
jgi:hypothetical protein